MESNASTPEAVTETTTSANSTYSVSFVNDSNQFGYGCIYQLIPNFGGEQVYPLAWLCQSAAPKSQVNFQWNTDYSFYMSLTGSIAPGTHINPMVRVAADPYGQNSVTLEGENGMFYFSTPTSGSQPGVLNINVSSGIPPGQLSVGIGMGDAPVLAAQAYSNMNYNFPANPQYCIVFSESLEAGQVLSPESLHNSMVLSFTPGSNSVKAVLNPNMTWTIQPA